MKKLINILKEMIRFSDNISYKLRMNLNRSRIRLMMIKLILIKFILCWMKIVKIDKNYIDNVGFWKIKWTL